MTTTRILRLPEVMQRTGLGKTTIYKFIAEGRLPSPIKLGGRSSGWLWLFGKAKLFGRHFPVYEICSAGFV